MGKKHTYKYVFNFFEENGCILLEKEYKNARTKMNYICECGNESEISFSCFKNGTRCMNCKNKLMRKLLGFNYEYVFNILKEGGCKLLDDEYINNSTPMNYICKCGNKSKITLDHFKIGHRCNECKKKKLSGDRRFSFEYIKNFIQNEGYILLSNNYINSNSALEMLCIKNHPVKNSFGNFKRGQRCRKCYFENCKGENSHKYKPDREKLREDKIFRKKCRHSIYSVLKAIGKNKSNKTAELNGYSYKELKEHIVNHPNWNKVKHNWSLDHIFPIQALVDYDLREMEHIKIINGLDNLQPLLDSENCSKRDKYDKEEFEKWLNGKNIKFTSKNKGGVDTPPL